VSFTGSTTVGKHLAGLCAQDLKRTTMELGGHAPAIVFGDADVEAAVDMLAGGKFRNAGQVCIAPTRIFVQARVWDRFLDSFVRRVDALRVGDGSDPDVQMGPVANPRRIEAMERMVADGRARGGEVVAGGERLGNSGYFFRPTVMTDMPDDSLAMTEEPFGPIAPLTAFTDFDEVIARANALPYGLASYAFTTGAQRALAVARALKAGMVGVNTLAISSPETPFGGVRHSGHGQEGGVEGLAAYLDVKMTALG